MGFRISVQRYKKKLIYANKNAKKVKIVNSTLQNKEKSQKKTLTYCIYQIKVYFTINKPTTQKKLLPRPIVVQHFTLI